MVPRSPRSHPVANKCPPRLVGMVYSRVCSNRDGLIRKYQLNICRQCFREYAADIGFKKVVIHPRRRCPILIVHGTQYS